MVSWILFSTSKFVVSGTFVILTQALFDSFAVYHSLQSCWHFLLISSPASLIAPLQLCFDSAASFVTINSTIELGLLFLFISLNRCLNSDTWISVKTQNSAFAPKEFCLLTVFSKDARQFWKTFSISLSSESHVSWTFVVLFHFPCSIGSDVCTPFLHSVHGVYAISFLLCSSCLESFTWLLCRTTSCIHK